MKRQTIFKLDETTSFHKVTADYFTKAGFRQTSQTENQITFKKGSTLLNMVTFNPLNWKSEIKVTLQNDSVTADFDINTVGQLPTPKEEKLWDTFVQNYKLSLTNKMDLATENQRQLTETKKDSLKYIKWAVIGAIVFGVPFGFLAYFTGIDSLASTGASIGAVCFVAFRVNEERKKNMR